MGFFLSLLILVLHSCFLLVRLAASLASEGFLKCIFMHTFTTFHYSLFVCSWTQLMLVFFSFSSKIVELWTKRRFRCDCGNSKFGGHLCKLCPEKDSENPKNGYNHNFKGSYCTCGRPYPDPEAKAQVEMIQCCICEDWFHEDHIGLNSIEEVFYLPLSLFNGIIFVNYFQYCFFMVALYLQ